jgi:PAS domain S-box-containing protein
MSRPDRVKLRSSHREESLSVAVTAAVIGTWDWHVRENKVYANERFARTYSVDPEAAAAGAPIEDFIAAIHADDRPRVQRQIDSAIASGHQFAEEYRVVQEDGSVRWVLARGRCLRDADGTPERFSGAVTDITDRKADEDLERILAAETHHRFHNLLAMVQAIAVQTLTDGTPTAIAREAFLGRITAIGDAMRTLTERGQRTGDLRQIVCQALGGMSELPRFTIDGPAVTLGARPALSVSLAIHELSTNAVKHGALSVPGGAVSIRWSIEQRARALALEWIESGGLPVRPPVHKGFGSFLFDRILAAELGADIAVAFDPAGVRWRLTAPLSRLSA